LSSMPLSVKSGAFQPKARIGAVSAIAPLL
jgi:hypothetical protein